jgi:hypothetical protein
LMADYYFHLCRDRGGSLIVDMAVASGVLKSPMRIQIVR